MEATATNTELSRPLSVVKVEPTLQVVKLGKASDAESIYPQFLITVDCGKCAKTCLAQFFTTILKSRCIPPVFKRSKIPLLFLSTFSQIPPAHFQITKALVTTQ